MIPNAVSCIEQTKQGIMPRPGSCSSLMQPRYEEEMEENLSH